MEFWIGYLFGVVTVLDVALFFGCFKLRAAIKDVEASGLSPDR